MGLSSKCIRRWRARTQMWERKRNRRWQAQTKGDVAMHGLRERERCGHAAGWEEARDKVCGWVRVRGGFL
ncbi:hypothetical protein SORBI_3003G003101 [Sorghum bicolor]|uniref:Uncharacterized protein n=1 Tax=Sorghum bicolor TaxID=4558 RepID=A0A1B6Q0L1_SORBI|nr:hypothetical protein SORBI_3003G003101 [Sorghum bicolor]